MVMKDDDPRLLPPLSMLRCFEAAAREGTFSRAADQLGLTQSGVSRQIAHLEDWLGTPLFERHGRRVALNRTGQAYLGEVSAALGLIRAGTRRLIAPDDKGVTLATLPGFGMRWLAPRLPALSAIHPDLMVSMIARTDLFDFAAEDFDAAIHVGPPDWPAGASGEPLVHERLFAEVMVPVIAPTLAERLAIATPRDLLEAPLLALSAQPDAWARWFAADGLELAAGPPRQRFSQFLMLAQAAVAGAGAALLPRFLVEGELAAGLLTVPFDRPLEGTRSYFLVYPRRKARDGDFARFRAWLHEEALK
ncbi:LysR substrate-binding domain-containing protein [Novosphingobium olei]|nr:LysR substrate-binding domain-containing protein [Novosphingobium olei]